MLKKTAEEFPHVEFILQHTEKDTFTNTWKQK
jgi:hypothetical protein